MHKNIEKDIIYVISLDSKTLSIYVGLELNKKLDMICMFLQELVSISIVS
jgi:hypothetical protein